MQSKLIISDIGKFMSQTLKVAIIVHRPRLTLPSILNNTLLKGDKALGSKQKQSKIGGRHAYRVE